MNMDIYHRQLLIIIQLCTVVKIHVLDFKEKCLHPQLYHSWSKLGNINPFFHIDQMFHLISIHFDLQIFFLMLF